MWQKKRKQHVTWTRLQGLCPQLFYCVKMVEGAPVTISFYVKSRETPKEKRKLIFILQNKATQSYR